MYYEIDKFMLLIPLWLQVMCFIYIFEKNVFCFENHVQTHEYLYKCFRLSLYGGIIVSFMYISKLFSSILYAGGMMVSLGSGATGCFTNSSVFWDVMHQVCSLSIAISEGLFCKNCCKIFPLK